MSKLHVDSIVKKINCENILQDIFIQCNTNEIVGVLGRNGTGKSTLFKIIFGIISAENSYVSVDEKKLITQWDRRGKIAFLSQTSFLPIDQRVSKIIKLFCDDKNAETLRNYPFVQNILNCTCARLSSGENRFLSALIILHSNAKFALLDEPFMGLSPKRIEELQRVIVMQRANKGIIITDHLYEEVLKISDSIYLLAHKGLKLIRNVEELRLYGYLKL